MCQFSSYREQSYNLLKVGFTLLMIGFVLFKPLSSVLINPSEEGIELSEDLSEEDSEKESKETMYEYDLKWYSLEALDFHNENEMDVTFGDQHLFSEFRPEAILQPPKC